MRVEHERAVTLRSLVSAGKFDVPWRTHGVLLRVVFFGLTCAGVAALYFFFDALQVSSPGLVTGVIALTIAEVLIHRARWFWTGVEEALWIGGLFSMVTELPESGEPEAMLVLAAAAAIPGARMRNPIFGAVAAGFIAAYFEQKWDLGVIAALVIAAIAVAALLRTWRRPSNEWLWVAIAVALPVVGRFFGDEVWRDVTIVLYGAFGAVTFLLAVRKRHHALLFSGAIALAIACVDASQLVAVPPEAKLAAAGAFLLGGAWLVSRALRGRTTGVVTAPSSLTSFDDAIELAATAALPRGEFEPGREAGGEFGGAGATGKY